MKTYYIGNIPFNGEDSISHGRTKGSRNGYSTTPGYVPIGQKAGMVTDSGTGTVRRKKKSLWSTVSGAASSAARSVGKTASKAYGSASEAAKSAYSSGKEFITGGKAKQHYNATVRNNARLTSAANESANTWKRNVANSRAKQATVGRAYRESQLHDYKDTEAGKRTRQLMRDYGVANEQLRKDKERLAEAERKQKLANDKAERAERRAREKYEKTLPGKIEKAKTKLGPVASKKMSEVSAWASTTSGKAKEAARKAKTAVRSAGSTAVSKISTGASSTAGKVKNFLSGIFGKKKK